MNLIYFITHPEVTIDEHVPVPDWDLSERGVERAQAMLSQPWVTDLTKIYSSNEQKAKTTADILAHHVSLEVNHVEALGEMDRSATGFLPPHMFEPMVDLYFANPTISVRGWEVAQDTQDRIVNAVKQIVNESPNEDAIAIVSHGGVGGLLLTYVMQKEISRDQDQPNQGNYFVIDQELSKVVQGWKPIDNLSV